MKAPLPQPTASLWRGIEQHLPESLNTLSLADAMLENYRREQHLSEMWRAEMLLTEMGFDPATVAVTGHRLSGRPAYPAVTGTGADQQLI